MGSTPAPKVAKVYANVDGLMGISSESPFPAPHTVHVATRNQQNKPECRKILYCRWRRTRLTKGSYNCEAGGIVGAVRERSVDGIARTGVCGADMVVEGEYEGRARRTTSVEVTAVVDASGASSAAVTWMGRVFAAVAGGLPRGSHIHRGAFHLGPPCLVLK